MGVAKTLPNYKSFTFDGTNSRNYGVYITGQGVFNAPERNVEMVEIPGRNGAYALDKGNFNNIEVTYPAGIFADTEADFAQAVSDLRNFLCSKSGYCRLEDDYNSGEYRMAIYKSGLEVTHEMLIAGEFNIVFECKPQRWLTSGETAVAVANGGTLTNPTLFDSSPLLEVNGLGGITIGTQTITINNVTIGKIVIAEGASFLNGNSSPQSTSFTIDDTLLNGGDPITINKVVVHITYSMTGFAPNPTGGIVFVSGTNLYVSSQTEKGVRELTTNEASFSYGTSSTFTATANCTMTISGTTYSYTYTIAIAYDGADGFTITISDNASLPAAYHTRYSGNTYSDVMGDSSTSALGNPIYIDCDIGEAWNEDYGTPVSVNNAVVFGANLPVLPSNTTTTTITFDNTITSLKVAPRWWKV